MSVYVSPTSMMTAVAPPWKRTGLRADSHLPPVSPAGAPGLPTGAGRSASPALPPPPGPGLIPAITHAAAWPWLPALRAWVPQLTQTRRAGIGVQCLTWIMASRLGRCPSRAPEKHSPGGVGTEVGGSHEPSLGPRCWPDPDLSLDLMALLSCHLRLPALGPSSPTGQFFPSSSPPPSCFLFLAIGI